MNSYKLLKLTKLDILIDLSVSIVDYIRLNYLRECEFYACEFLLFDYYASGNSKPKMKI